MGPSSPLEFSALTRDSRVRPTCLLSGLQKTCQWLGCLLPDVLTNMALWLPNTLQPSAHNPLASL